MRTVTVSIVESEESHAVALTRVRELWRAADGTEEAAERELLILQIEAYEKTAVVFERSTPQAIVRSVMDSQGLSQKDLAPIFGSQGRVSEFLTGKRALSASQAVRLHLKYRLPLELLMNVDDLPTAEDGVASGKGQVGNNVAFAG